MESSLLRTLSFGVGMVVCVGLHAAKDEEPVAARGEEQSNLPKHRLVEERTVARVTSDASNVDRVASAAGCSKSFAVVDLAEVYGEFYPAKEAEENLRVLKEDLEVVFGKMVDEGKPLFKERDELIKKLDAPALSEEARKKLEERLSATVQEIQQKGQAIGQFRQEKEMKLNEYRQTVLAEHFKEISLGVERVAKKNDLDCVFNRASMLYVKPGMDLTADVIREVNEPYRKEIKEAEKKAAAKKAEEATTAETKSKKIKQSEEAKTFKPERTEVERLEEEKPVGR